MVQRIVLLTLLASLINLSHFFSSATLQAEQPNPASGKKAPSFTLNDQSGRERSLDELLKKGNVALVFHRSADW